MVASSTPSMLSSVCWPTALRSAVFRTVPPSPHVARTWSPTRRQKPLRNSASRAQLLLIPKETPMDDVTAALKRRLAKLTDDFAKKHPARAAARKYLDDLVAAKRHAGPACQDKERGMAADDLGGHHGMLEDLL